MKLGDLNEHRRTRLQQLVDERFEGNKAALGRALGYLDGAFVGQMLRGERPITEKTVAQVDGLPGGRAWFMSTDATAPAPPAPHISDTISALAGALQGMDSTQREQAGSLLQSLARDPGGPWADWLAQLLNSQNSKSGNTKTEIPAVGNKQLHAKQIDTEGGGGLQIDTAKVTKRPSIFNLGIFDAEQPPRAPQERKKA